MTKAERIYRATRWECKNSLETFGYSECNGKAVGFNTVHHEDNESICNRTLNEIEHLLASDRKMLEMDKRLSLLADGEYEKTSQLYNMIESTILNARESISA